MAQVWALQIGIIEEILGAEMCCSLGLVEYRFCGAWREVGAFWGVKIVVLGVDWVLVAKIKEMEAVSDLHKIACVLKTRPFDSWWHC